MQVPVDDGYSSVDFNRPSFQSMLQDIKEGNINCVVVKDLSRLGRNYIEVGKYVQKIFPVLGVRFIAVNDNYDSASEKTQSDDIIIPFKNLINDAYSRDISIKIRSNLEVKRKKGEFIGSFVAYGYKKSKENRNKIVIDEYAAMVVKDIFDWKIKGMSQQAIADKLNTLGILSPMEYKRICGLNYASSFKVHHQAKWCLQSVGRVLKNEIYTGVLIQGKKTTPNYKIKKVICKRQEDWIRIENSHEAILEKKHFDMVQELLKADTRTSPTRDTVYLLSGLVTCADCGNSMVRKTIPTGGKSPGTAKKYVYYVCSGNKKNKSCSSHSVNDKKLEEAVYRSILTHIEAVLDIEKMMRFVKTLPLNRLDLQKMDQRMQKNQEEIDKCNKLKVSLYEDMREQLISKEEFIELKQEFTRRAEASKRANQNMLKEMELISSNQDGKYSWIECFKEHRNMSTLQRNIVVTLIEKILIYEDGRIFVKFRYQDKFDLAMQYVQQAKKECNLPNQEKEAV